MSLKKITKFIFLNKLLSLFFAIIIAVFIIAIFRMLTSEPTDLYVKVKMGQGLWWASTSKPPVWFTKALLKGDAEYDLLGKPIATILDYSYYPVAGVDNVDIFITIKLAAQLNKKTHKYVFKRSSVTVGSPIDFDFPSTQVTGTVIALSDKPLNDHYVDKTVYLYRRFTFPWEYDDIFVGDEYFNGEKNIFTVLEKTTKTLATGTFFATISEGIDFSNLFSDERELVIKVIYLKTKIRFKQNGKNLIFGEELPVSVGKKIPIKTNRYNYEEFTIAKIE